MSRFSTPWSPAQGKKHKNPSLPLEKIGTTKGATRISKKLLTDDSLSYEARGLLASLLSFPDDQELTFEFILSVSSSGKDRVYRILKEAESSGYVRRVRSHRKGGNFGKTLYAVSDCPETLDKVPSGIFVGSKETFVYVIQDRDLVKVGVSDNPEQRCAAISAKHGPTQLRFTFQATREAAAFIESSAHRKLASVSVGGEWFRCPPDIAIRVVQSVISGGVS